MNLSPPNKALGEIERKLSFLLLEIKDTPVAERVGLYVAKVGGGARDALAYLRDEAIPLKERATLGATLTDILLTKSYDRLPPLNTVEEERPEMAPDDMPALVRREARRQLADTFEKIARVLRESL